MYVIPFQVSETTYSIMVVLLDENIERIKQRDPAEVTMKSLGSLWESLKLKDIIITYTTEAEMAQMMQLCATGRTPEALRRLTRGFVFRPDKGDHDGPYLSMKPNPGDKSH